MEIIPRQMKSKSRRYATKIKFTVKEMEFLSNNED